MSTGNKCWGCEGKGWQERWLLLSRVCKLFRKRCKYCNGSGYFGRPQSDPAHETTDLGQKLLQRLSSANARLERQRNESVQGTPDILAELRARAKYEMTAAYKAWSLAKSNAMQYDEGAAWARHRLAAKMLTWLDELNECQTKNTAPDTTSGSAGVP